MKIQNSKETKKTQSKILSSQILKVSQRENKENKGGEFRKEIMQEKFPELTDKNFHLERAQHKKKKEKKGKKELNNYKNIHTGADMDFQKSRIKRRL